MVEAKFTNNMRSTIQNMKGKIFKSYEGVLDGKGEEKFFYGNFRINLGLEAIEFSNHLEVTQFPGSVEEVSCFRCEKIDKNSKFQPYLAGPHLVYMVNERIKSVAIVVDTVKVDDGAYEIEFDMALVVRTPHNVYTFTRDWFYEETIGLRIDSKEEKPFELERVLKQWHVIQENVEVSRRIEEL